MYEEAPGFRLGPRASVSENQGFTLALVHFSAHRKLFLWDMRGGVSASAKYETLFG